MWKFPCIKFKGQCHPLLATLDRLSAPLYLSTLIFKPTSIVSIVWQDASVLIWHVDSGALHKSHSLSGHTKAVTDLDWSPHEPQLLTASSDVKLWSTDCGQCIRTYSYHLKGVQACCWLSHGKRFMSSGHNGIAIRDHDSSLLRAR